MKKIILAASIVLLVIVISSFAFFASVAKKYANQYRHDFLGLNVDIKEMDFNWFSYALELKGVKIYPKGSDDEKSLLASADKLNTEISLIPLLWNTIYIKKIELINPSVKYISWGNGRNWDALDLKRLKNDEKESGPKKTGWALRIDKFKIKNGNISWVDNVNGGRFELTKMNVEISDLSSSSKAKSLPTKLKLRAKLAETNAPIKMDGRMNLFSEGLNMELKGSMNGAPLTYFAPFYRNNISFRINSGQISINSHATIKNSYLTSSHSGVIVNLDAGGVKGKIINTLVKSLGGKVNLHASVNGDLTGGRLKVSAALSKSFGEALLAKAKDVSPVEAVGEKVKNVGTSIKEGVGKLFK